MRTFGWFSSLLYEMENIELEINDENEEIRPLPSTDDDSEPTVIYESAAYYSEQAVLSASNPLSRSLLSKSHFERFRCFFF